MIKKLLGILLLIPFLASCEEDQVDYGYGEYYVELVTFVSGNTFLLDTGMPLYSHTTVSSSLQEGDRLYLVFSYLDEDTSLPQSLIRVIGYSAVLSGSAVEMEESQVVADPVKLQSVWLGGQYLNLSFYMNYRSQAHKIGLAYLGYDEEQQVERFRFLHDENGDPAGYSVQLILSFDLKELLGSPRKETTIAFSINTGNYGDKEYEFLY